jgi:hypothetical protein
MGQLMALCAEKSLPRINVGVKENSCCDNSRCCVFSPPKKKNLDKFNSSDEEKKSDYELNVPSNNKDIAIHSRHSYNSNDNQGEKKSHNELNVPSNDKNISIHSRHSHNSNNSKENKKSHHKRNVSFDAEDTSINFRNVYNSNNNQEEDSQYKYDVPFDDRNIPINSHQSNDSSSINLTEATYHNDPEVSKYLVIDNPDSLKTPTYDNFIKYQEFLQKIVISSPEPQLPPEYSQKNSKLLPYDDSDIYLNKFTKPLYNNLQNNNNNLSVPRKSQSDDVSLKLHKLDVKNESSIVTKPVKKRISASHKTFKELHTNYKNSPQVKYRRFQKFANNRMLRSIKENSTLTPDVYLRKIVDEDKRRLNDLSK